MKKRVVITGLGAITPIGKNVLESWNSIKQKKCGIDEITLFDASNFKTKLDAEVKEYDQLEYFDLKQAKRLDRSSQFAIIAAREAIADSKIERENTEKQELEMQDIYEEKEQYTIEDLINVCNILDEKIRENKNINLDINAIESKKDIYNDVIACSNFGNIFFIRQKETKGLGHAVLCAKSFVGNEPFAVLYGDDVIISDTPVTKQLCDAYDKYSKGCVGVKPVPKKDITKYCTLAVEKLEGNCFNCTDMIEKPKPEEIMSNYSILGRVVLPPEIFDILENTPLGAGNELQLTDAMKTLAQTQGVIAVDYEGKRYDMGNKFGILQANIEVGLNHPDTKEELKAYIKELAKTL